jgi:ATP-binding cassette subfamily B protein/subfamily B ATP-binding cassette protein MsbA
MIFKIIKRIFLFALPYRTSLIVSTVALLVIIGINLYAPMLARDLIDKSDWNSQSVVIAITLVSTYLLRGIMRSISNTISHFASLNTCALIQSKVYEHLQRLSRSFYADHHTGDLMTRVNHDVDQVEELISHALPDTASNIILAVGVTIAMFYINHYLAAITLLTILPVLFVGLFQKKVRSAFRIMNDATAEQNSVLNENLQGIREIQLFNRQGYENERIGQKFFDVAKAAFKAIRWYSFLSPGIEFFTSLGQVIVIAAGGYMIAAGGLTSGDVVAFLLYIGLFYGPVSALSNTLETIQKAAAGAARVFEVLDQPISIADGSIDAGRLNGEISFKGVSFAYHNSELILDNIDMSIPSGQSVALICTTGAGKTTILNLIIRLFDPKQGEVCIDNVNIQEFTLASLRNNISIVSQDVFLFSGSIYDNIIYSKPSATPEEVYSAAKNAAIHEFIISLKDGYETKIGEKGAKLSGGQRQRIAIARALLRDTPILLLDEATSAVDEATEKEIRKTVMDSSKGKTLLIVTHRMTTVADVDRVITISGGRILSDVVKYSDFN